ncbi:MAG TPA: metallophosphoesterase [Actinomycetota bacterium]
MIRIAAAGDLHVGADSEGTLRPAVTEIAGDVDAVLLAGDLTKAGLEEEAEVLAHELEEAGVPVIAVLGNHDLHSDQADRVRGCLERAGVVILEGETHIVRVSGTSLGIAGIRGFGGGFAGASATEFGEPEMKRFVRVTVDAASALRSCLERLETDVRVALLHYSPVRDTLHGEPSEIYPFLGSYLLAEAVDAAGCDLVLHGHAHRGIEWGITPGGVPVRNVAQPVIRRAFAVYSLDPRTRLARSGSHP